MSILINTGCGLGHSPQQALAQADQLCQQRGARLTVLRRRVLEIIWNSPKPLGAYTILETLQNHDGRQGAPPTVYRALDFLLAQGLIHRLATLNMFTGCSQPGNPHSGQFLICCDCNQVNEINDSSVETLLTTAAAAQQFTVLTQTVEVLGRCPICQRQLAPNDH